MLRLPVCNHARTQTDDYRVVFSLSCCKNLLYLLRLSSNERCVTDTEARFRCKVLQDFAMSGTTFIAKCEVGQGKNASSLGK